MSKQGVRLSGRIFVVILYLVFSTERSAMVRHGGDVTFPVNAPSTSGSSDAANLTADTTLPHASVVPQLPAQSLAPSSGSSPHDANIPLIPDNTTPSTDLKTVFYHRLLGEYFLDGNTTQSNDVQSDFYHQLLVQTFPKLCTCEDCAPQLYLNFPYSCPQITHMSEDIFISPHEKPYIAVLFKVRPYEALHLAHSAIQYFSRPEVEMAPSQQKALDDVRDEINAGLMEKLGSPDARNTFPANEMMTLCTQLQSVFFFGAPIEIEVTWNFDLCERFGWYGVTETVTRNSCTEFERIAMHPTKVTAALLFSGRCSAESVGRQRFSTLVHELIHAMLERVCCRGCVASKDNLAPHGRAFQRLAEAVEEECLRLMGLKLDLARMNGVWSDMVDDINGANFPSLHDLKAYGFV